MKVRLRKVVTIVAVMLGLVGVGLVGFFLWASSGTTNDDAVSPGEVVVLDEDVALAAAMAEPREITVLGFNIAYGRGPGGDEAGPWTRDHIVRHLDGIAEQIRASGADIAALQEVDLVAHRSNDIDEARYLADKLGWPVYACVLTWENNYVPYPYWPPARHYGRMRSGQCVLSRFPIVSSTRYRLPQPEANPFYYNAFYLHRALQHVVVDLGAGRVLDLVNVHLEAFDKDNREKQVATLQEVIGKSASPFRIVVGDFNALPPGASKKHDFTDEPDADFRGDETMSRIFAIPELTEVLTRGAASADDPSTLTYPAEAPTRRLDYIFVGAGFEVTDAKVMSEGAPWSDHLPIVARLSVARRAP